MVKISPAVLVLWLLEWQESSYAVSQMAAESIWRRVAWTTHARNVHHWAVDDPRARRTLVSCRPRHRSQCHGLIPVTRVTNVKRRYRRSSPLSVVVSVSWSADPKDRRTRVLLRGTRDSGKSQRAAAIECHYSHTWDVTKNETDKSNTCV